jgi:hypothetical protein
MKLTDAMARQIAPPDTGNRLRFDDAVRGLALRVTAAGARSWVLRYRADGTQRALTLGSYPDWSVAQARERARALKRRIDEGEDPLANKHAKRTAPTVAELAELYLAEHADVAKRASPHDHCVDAGQG